MKFVVFLLSVFCLALGDDAKMLALCTQYTVAQNSLDAVATAKLFTLEATAELPAGFGKIIKGNADILAAYKALFSGFKTITETDAGFGYQIAGNYIGHMKIFSGMTTEGCPILIPANQLFIYNTTANLFEYTGYVANVTEFGRQMNCKN